MLQLQALNDLVVLQPIEATETKTEGGIIIPKEINEANQRIVSGKVLSIGKDVTTGEKGINVGDTVFYNVGYGVAFENFVSIKEINCLWKVSN